MVLTAIVVVAISSATFGLQQTFTARKRPAGGASVPIVAAPPSVLRRDVERATFRMRRIGVARFRDDWAGEESGGERRDEKTDLRHRIEPLCEPETSV